MRLLLLTLVAALLAAASPSALHAQTAPQQSKAMQSKAMQSKAMQELVEAASIPRNAVTQLHAEGDSLWIGPILYVTPDGGETWLRTDEPVFESGNERLYSIDVETPAGADASVVWAGLGFVNDDGVPSGAGFLLSRDGGENFISRQPPLEQPTTATFDTLSYGVSELPAFRVSSAAQAPPYDVDYDAASDVVWSANWAAGLRRSEDGGRTWARVILPPDGLDRLHPDSSYAFPVVVPGQSRELPGNFNHTAFSVLVDETGTVWAGTPEGVNRSRPQDLVAVGDSTYRGWQRFDHDGTADGLTGSWVISIEEQPLPGRNPVWMATWNASETGERGRSGITVTRDGGETFEPVLFTSDGSLDRINDFAFRGDTVYAAGRESGLYLSSDGGTSWRTIRDFEQAPGSDVTLPLTLDVFAVATTNQALWVGTDVGLLKSTDGGASWTVFRTDVPLQPEEETDRVPDVEAYAYPNPFSPAVDQLIRIRYDSDGGEASVRIFDFGKRLVREFDDDCFAAPCEASWDGTDYEGRRVANGPYLYAVETDDETIWGKILVIE